MTLHALLVLAREHSAMMEHALARRNILTQQYQKYVRLVRST